MSAQLIVATWATLSWSSFAAWFCVHLNKRNESTRFGMRETHRNPFLVPRYHCTPVRSKTTCPFRRSERDTRARCVRHYLSCVDGGIDGSRQELARSWCKVQQRMRSYFRGVASVKCLNADGTSRSRLTRSTRDGEMLHPIKGLEYTKGCEINTDNRRLGAPNRAKSQWSVLSQQL